MSGACSCTNINLPHVFQYESVITRSSVERVPAASRVTVSRFEHIMQVAPDQWAHEHPVNQVNCRHLQQTSTADIYGSI